MKRILLTVIGLLALPGLALAQVYEFCNDCTLGIYDDVALNKNFGTATAFSAKEIYVGVNLGAGHTGVSGIEFSIAGFVSSEVLVTGTEGATEIAPNITLGSPPAPADTSSTSTGSGGMNVAWAACVSGSGPLLKITLLPLAPTPNRVLRVLHKFPTSSPLYLGSPVITACDAPTYTPARVQGGCYVFAWDGLTDPAECTLRTGVETKTWTAVKQLFD